MGSKALNPLWSRGKAWTSIIFSVEYSTYQYDPCYSENFGIKIYLSLFDHQFGEKYTVHLIFPIRDFLNYLDFNYLSI